MMASKWLAVVLWLCTVASAGGSVRVIYVDAGAAGAGDGSSWADAYPYLQDALAEAATRSEPVEIRVAQGFYKPDEGVDITPGDRTAAFQLLNGVTLKGGYAGGTLPDPDACDPKRYETVLSGDLRGDDIGVDGPHCYICPLSEPTRADNSFQVVTASRTDETAVLDGFVITGSHRPQSAAGAQYDFAPGSAMYIGLGSPSILHCVFRDNYSSNGGAVYSRDSSPAFSDCTFDRNGSPAAGAVYSDNSRIVLDNCIFFDNVGGKGGAIYNGADGSAELVNCTFDRNRTTSVPEGGAILSETTLTLTGCTFRQNSAAFRGGAVCARFGTLVVSGCGFFENTVALTGMPSEGGAVYVQWGAVATFTDCAFEGNAASSGGAIYSDLTCARIVRCRFTDNTAVTAAGGSFLSRGGGGAIAARSTAMKLTGCDFQGNRAFDGGGAVLGALAARLVFANCLLAGNRAEYGGGICMEHTTSGGLRLNNCTLASNFAGDGFALTGSGVLEHCIVWGGSGLMPSSYRSSTAIYCDIQGGFSDEGDIDADPSRVRPEMPSQPSTVSHNNIDVDPLFVRPGYWADAGDPTVAAGPESPNAIWVAGDYHLKSQAGHWDPGTESWVRDDVTSPCIDAGDIGSPIGSEPFPNGGILNLGAYGGTVEASKSYFGEPMCESAIAGDINGDCTVDLADFALMSYNWLRSAPRSNQAPAIVISEPSDGAVVQVGSSNPTILVKADASDPDGFIMEVTFVAEHKAPYRTRRSLARDENAFDVWQWLWRFWDASQSCPEGQYTIWAYAIDNDGAIAFSPEVTITVNAAK